MDKDDAEDVDDNISASLPGDVRALVKEPEQEADKSSPSSRGIGRGWWKLLRAGDDFKDETLRLQQVDGDGGRNDDFVEGERLLRGEGEEDA
jgi:hypothetical protein